MKTLTTNEKVFYGLVGAPVAGLIVYAIYMLLAHFSHVATL